MEKNFRLAFGHRSMVMGGGRDRKIWEREDERMHSVVLSSCLRITLFLFTVSFMLLAFSTLTPPSQASDTLLQEQDGAKGASKISAKAKFSFGYDNNVSEQLEDNKLESRFFQFYISSDMYTCPLKRTLLSLKLQNGIKYLDAPSLSDESVLINGLNLRLSHAISERWVPEIQSEIKNRISIHTKSGVPPSEEAYLRGSIGAALKFLILSDVTGKAFYHYKVTNLEDFDPFDRDGFRMGLRADVRLLPESTISIQYSRERMRFHKWNLISIYGKSSRLDILDEISLFTQLYKYFLFDITYSYQNNKSDVSAYSYRANKLALLLARSFPRGIMFQLYALVRSKKYHSVPTETVWTQVDLEDDEHGLLTVELSKDINEAWSLEAQYDLRRGSSYEGAGTYTKGVFSCSLSFHF